ncbi:Altronate oxidoreductase [compost metagenome]
MAGLDTVDRAVATPALNRYLDRLMREEIAPTLPALPGLDLDAYRRRLLERFANPALAHRTAQIAMDGSQKLPQRLLGTVRERLAADASIDRLALAVAAWLHYLRGVDELGRRHEIQDPLADTLAERCAAAERAAAAAEPAQADEARVAVFAAFAPVFGNDLASSPRFVSAVATQLRALRELGVHKTLAAQA